MSHQQKEERELFVQKQNQERELFMQVREDNGMSAVTFRCYTASTWRSLHTLL